MKFLQDPANYLPLVFSRWEGMECMNYSPFVYADQPKNITITGEGTLDGQSGLAHWWHWKGRTGYGHKKGGPQQAKAHGVLTEMVERDVPVEQCIFG